MYKNHLGAKFNKILSTRLFLKVHEFRVFLPFLILKHPLIITPDLDIHNDSLTVASLH